MATPGTSDDNDPPPGLRYKDKVCIVTGGASGIGEGIARTFVRHGAKVVICDREVDRGRMLETALTTKGPGSALLIPCDVTKEEEIKNMVDETVDKFGGIDCLINNAGSHPPPQTIDEVTADEFRKLIDLNLIGYFLTCKYALPHLRKSRGSIINNASLVASIGQAAAIPYVATKGAISAMTRALAIDEAANHVRVNAFSPSSIWTPMYEEIANTVSDKQAFIKEGQDFQLIGRFGTLQEAGELCLFLATEATFMTGVDLPLSGGAELNYGRKTRMRAEET